MKSNSKKSDKSFEKWNRDEIARAFGVKRLAHSPLLEKWLQYSSPITQMEKDMLETLRKSLEVNADLWNEEELKFKFISFVVNMAQLDTDVSRSFLDRKISAVVQDQQMSGIVDFLVATGNIEPQEPFFFLHEYKQERKRENDPLGQLLAAMLTAQALNAHEGRKPHPLYGCYVIGRMWFFVVLEGLEYSVSQEYIATQEAIFGIVSALRYVREEILTIIKGS
ncbi:MAG: hypothetical protein EAZ92_04390 [Candidatus Kapaibacterium sp.]|nr:MAG: hypothetical protein EAZ92_04390 [Candidatus Kapabacteria bacterium]